MGSYKYYTIKGNCDVCHDSHNIHIKLHSHQALRCSFVNWPFCTNEKHKKLPLWHDI
jgi:hypothetical protein